MVAGTPAYLAPEALTNPDRVDHRSDLYAMGAVGFCLLTGESTTDRTIDVDLTNRAAGETRNVRRKHSA